MVGIDFCGRFIDAAMKIQGGKVVQYGSQQVARLPSQALPSRVQLKQVYILLYLVHHLLIYMRNTKCTYMCILLRYCLHVRDIENILWY